MISVRQGYIALESTICKIRVQATEKGLQKNVHTARVVERTKARDDDVLLSARVCRQPLRQSILSVGTSRWTQNRRTWTSTKIGGAEQSASQTYLVCNDNARTI
jgi:hypothetical protein